MSGILNMVAALRTIDNNNVQSGDVAGGNVTFGSDGQMSGSSYSGISNWYWPTTGGIGGSYWLKCVKSSGPANFSGIVNDTWTFIGSGITVGASGGPGACNGSWVISDSAGGPVLGGGNITTNNAI